MAHISGTFSNASAGRLTVTLTGTFYDNGARDAGFPAGTSNYSLRAVVNGTGSEPIDRYAPASVFELDYPGGGVSWAVSTQTVATQTVSISTYGFQNLKITLELRKK